MARNTLGLTMEGSITFPSFNKANGLFWALNEDSPQQAAGYQNPKPRTLKTAPFGRPNDGAAYTFFRCLAA